MVDGISKKKLNKGNYRPVYTDLTNLFMFRNSLIGFASQPELDVLIGIFLLQELLEADDAVRVLKELVKSLGPLCYPGMLADHRTELIADPRLLWVLERNTV